MNQTEKIEIDLLKILKILCVLVPVLSVLIFIGGYTYASIFLYFFSIKATTFLSITDYPSIAIGSLIWGAVCGSIPFILELFTMQYLPKTTIEGALGKFRYYLFLFFAFLCTVLFLLGLYENNPKITYTSIMFIMLSFSPVACCFIQAKVQNHREIISFAFSLLLFFWAILTTAVSDAQSFIRQKNSNLIIHTQNEMTIKGKFIILTSSDNYFLYDPAVHETSIIRRSSITSIDIKKINY